MAEVYWDLEWTVLQQGFDYAYDKRLYDRLREGHARPVREHLYAGLDYQTRLARFLENHDEPRAATAFPDDVHQAAAIITFLSPGLRFFHQGEFEGARSAFRRTCGAGRTKRSIHNCRPSTTACSACFANRSFGKAVGNSWSAHGLGRQLDQRLLCRFRLAKRRQRPALGGGQLFAQPKPVLRPTSVPRRGRSPMADRGFASRGELRSRRHRPSGPRPLHRRSAVGQLRVQVCLAPVNGARKIVLCSTRTCHKWQAYDRYAESPMEWGYVRSLVD